MNFEDIYVLYQYWTTPIKGFFDNNVQSYGIFPICAKFDIVPGKQFFIFLKIKQKISQMKQLFHNLNLRRKYDTNKHQRWGLIVKNFLGYNAVVSCPGETFFL